MVVIARRLREQGLPPDECIELAESLVEQVRADPVQEVRESLKPDPLDDLLRKSVPPTP